MDAIRISDTTGVSSVFCWVVPCPGCSALYPSGQFPGQPARLLKKFGANSESLASWKARYNRIMPGLSEFRPVHAQKELIPLAIIAVVMPLLVGLVLEVEALGGFLAGVILSGQLLAVFMANAGGAWDNAKKSIEDEPRNLAANTGKGSERHKAGVVGDTVGDPLKDTAGPALNPMIKVVNLVSLLAAPIIVKYEDLGVVGWVVVVVLFAATIWAISQSKKPVADITG